VETSVSIASPAVAFLVEDKMDTIIVNKALCRGVNPISEFEKFEELPAVIAGGSIRKWFVGEKQDSDIDIFPIDTEDYTPIQEYFKLKNKVYSTKNADTYRDHGKIYQIIKMKKKSIDELLDSFDYKHCQFAYDGKEIHSTPEAVITATRKQLMIHKYQKGLEINSIMRSYKYCRKYNFQPCLGFIKELSSIFDRLKPEEIQEQIELSPETGKMRIITLD
jgi:hypothetical protein